MFFRNVGKYNPATQRNNPGDRAADNFFISTFIFKPLN